MLWTSDCFTEGELHSSVTCLGEENEKANEIWQMLSRGVTSSWISMRSTIYGHSFMPASYGSGLIKSRITAGDKWFSQLLEIDFVVEVNESQLNKYQVNCWFKARLNRVLTFYSRSAKRNKVAVFYLISVQLALCDSRCVWEFFFFFSVSLRFQQTKAPLICRKIV